MAQMPHHSLQKIQHIKIIPLLPPTTFHNNTKQPHSFIYTQHTPQTNIYYPLHLPKSYTLIHQTILKTLNITHQQIKQVSLFNLRKL
ncbi:DUF1444 family protein, partial [Staphylococcus capitis]|uniref:DUF1444 family protein n=1 Tax=Staphylococcus capitis TaxID=29388 RepID=UPI0021B47610